MSETAQDFPLAVEPSKPVMSREDFLAIQLSNSEIQKLQLRFQLLLQQQQQLAAEKVTLEERQNKLMAELNTKYGVDLLHTTIDPTTREIRSPNSRVG
jgi:Mlc titration factor MtfA (ptsG expression regulator)